MLNIIRNLLLCFFCGTVVAETVDDIAFITEQYTPYNFESDDKLQGIAVDRLSLMLQRVGSSQTRKDLKSLPWARGYKRVQTVL